MEASEAKNSAKRAEFGVLPNSSDRDKLPALEELRRALENPGHDAVDINVLPGVGHRQRAGELEHGALGASIGEHAFAAAQAPTGGDIDNLAALLLDHLRQYRPAAVELAGQVGIHAVVPIRIGQFVQRLAHILGVAAGVVDQDIDPAQLPQRRLRHRIDLIGAGDVGLRDHALAAGGADLGGGLLQLGKGARGHYDVGSGLGEPNRHRPAQAAPRAGYYRDFALKLEAVEDHASSCCHCHLATI